MAKRSRGWPKEPARHALAAKGVPTKRKSRYIVGHSFHQPEHIDRETADILKIEHELGHWEDDPVDGTMFRDVHSGERLKFVEVQRHPRTREIVNVVFLDESGELRYDRDFREVYPSEG
jgi:hypothetical protein